MKKLDEIPEYQSMEMNYVNAVKKIGDVLMMVQSIKIKKKYQ